MCPQKWNASARCDFTAAATTLPPETASSSRPTRERKPRRVLLATTASLSAGSRMRRLQAALGRRKHALQLEKRVERALREHRSLGADDDAVRAARDPELVPELPVLLLVEDLQLDVRIGADELHRRLERLAQRAAGGREDGECERGAAGKAVSQRRTRADLRALAAHGERRLRRDREPQLADLPGERQQRERQGGESAERDGQAGDQPRLGRRPGGRKPRDGREGERERSGPGDGARRDLRA